MECPSEYPDGASSNGYGSAMRGWRRDGKPLDGADEAFPSMDGKVVGRALREQVRPLLRQAGFTTFTDRKAWRETEHTIDHVTIRSFNAYNAGVFGCTTYSTTTEVGVFYRCLDPNLTRPQDYDCTFRATLAKKIRQPFFVTEWGPARDMWSILHVLPDGSNLDQVVSEAVAMLTEQGIPYMDHFNDPERAFNSLMTDRMIDGDFGQPFKMFPGNPGSPNWRETSMAIGRLLMDDPTNAILAAPVLGSD